MRFFATFCTFLAILTCTAAELPGYLFIKPNGTLTLDTRWTLAVNRYNPKWSWTSQQKLNVASGFPKTAPGLFETSGTFDGFLLTQKVEATGPKSFRLQVGLKAEKDPVPSNLVFLPVNIPLGQEITLTIDGKTIGMPKEPMRKNVYDARAKRAVISDPDGEITITGDFRAIAAGSFKNADGYYYQLRLVPLDADFKKLPAAVREWNLTIDVSADFTKTEVKSFPLNITKTFNRSFVDEVAEDGKGGWTDQGPGMDLSAFQPGSHNFHSVRMNTVDPAKNDGKSCLILGRGAGKTAAVDLKDVPKGMNYLYLLHASGWTPSLAQPVGFLKITYTDGKTEEIPVKGGIDCGNWYKPTDGSNARIVWSADDPQAGAGLYLTSFPLKGVPRRLEFRDAENESMWMVAAASVADGKVRFPRKTAFTVKNGPRWLPIEFSGATAPGTPLDFSIYRDAPAGKYGHMIVDKEGHLTFENAPGKRIRLFGPNLVGSANYLSRDMVDDFIDKAERLGYNTIRFHHFENDLLDRKAADSLTIDPAKLDQLHYLFARLKQHGFYITIDLYASRALKPGDNIPESDGSGEYAMKNLVCISPAALENWKEFSRRVLTAKNPYTGMSMAEDPALFMLNLVNENALIAEWNGGRASRSARALIEKKFEEYLKENKLDGPRDQERRNGLFIEFLVNLQGKCIAEQMRFLREEVGLKALIADLNNHCNYTLTGLRSMLDLVDNHQYWDHPSFPLKRWDYPFVFQNRSSISMNANNPRSLMPTRVFGKPFTVTEFNFCVPNTYRVECPSVFGGYAALQDWDGLYRFAWSHGRDGMRKDAKRRLNQFDIVNNIQAQMAERIMFMLFVRGDVKPADPAIAFEFRPEQLREIQGTTRSGNFPAEFTNLGLWGRIGSLTQAENVAGVQKVNPADKNWDAPLPAAARKAMKELEEKGTITSCTGEITLDNKANEMRIVTPRSEVLTTGRDAAGKVMRVVKPNVYQTFALMSLDNKPLVESDRMLLVQLSDLSNDQLRFDSDKRRVLRDWGSRPLMLERGAADIELVLPRPMNVVPLELDGTPAEKPLQTKYQGGKLTFRAATDILPGGNLSYLLTPEK